MRGVFASERIHVAEAEPNHARNLAFISSLLLFGFLLISFADHSVTDFVDRLAAVMVTVVGLTLSDTFRQGSRQTHFVRRHVWLAETVAVALLLAYLLIVLVSPSPTAADLRWLGVPAIAIALFGVRAASDPSGYASSVPVIWEGLGAVLTATAITATVLGLLSSRLASGNGQSGATWMEVSIFLWMAIAYAIFSTWHHGISTARGWRSIARTAPVFFALMLGYGALGTVFDILDAARQPAFTNLALASGLIGLWNFRREDLLRSDGPVIQYRPEPPGPGWPFVAAATGALVAAALLASWGFEQPRGQGRLGFAMLAILAIVATAGSIFYSTREIRRIVVRSRRAHRSAEEASLTDALTGLPNRRAADQRLITELRRAERYGRVFSVALLDIDNFKTVNDELGHAAGDRVLQQVAGAVAATVRVIDVPSRYGGEEFLVLLPETSRSGAAIVGERLRRAITSSVRQGGDSQRFVTVSVGIATFPEDAETAPGLMQAADQALYVAKRQGKNQVVTANLARSPQ